jgi:hypothetical protein
METFKYLEKYKLFLLAEEKRNIDYEPDELKSYEMGMCGSLRERECVAMANRVHELGLFLWELMCAVVLGKFPTAQISTHDC